MAPTANSNKWLPLTIILSAPFLVVTDTFIFNVALPSIQGTLHADNASLQLIISGYALAYATLLITGGRLGDIYGRKKLFVLGLALFGLTSAVGALSPTPIFLTVIRILQGIAAAVMYPQALSIVQANYSGHDRKIAFSCFGMTIGLSSSVAQLIGGLIIQANILGLAWRPIFLINVPISLIAILLAWKNIQETEEHKKTKLDLGGVLLIAASLSLLTVPLIIGRELGWPAWVLPALAFSVVSATLFARFEKILSLKGGAPLLNLDLFKIRTFTVGLLLTIFFYAGQVAMFFILSLYLQHGLEFSPLKAALVFTPMAAGFFLTSLFTPLITSKHLITVGSLIHASSMITLSLIALISNPQDNPAYLLPVLFIAGIGPGLVVPSLISKILELIPTSYAGAASGVLLTTQQIAGAIGIAIAGIIFFGMSQQSSSQIQVAFSFTLWYNAAMFMVTALLALILKSKHAVQ